MIWLMSLSLFEFIEQEEDEFARKELLEVSLKQELEEALTQRANDYSYLFGLSYRVVARKLKVRPNTISKARRKIARELRKKLV